MEYLRVLLTIACVFALTSCSRSPGGQIESVLNKCAKLSEQVNGSKMSAAESAAFFADRMQEIDTRGCPQDFRLAFQQHINAWRNGASAFSQNTTLNAFFEALSGGIANDFSQVGTGERNASMAVNDINSTYERLTEIAASNGAHIPHSVVNK